MIGELQIVLLELIEVQKVYTSRITKTTVKALDSISFNVNPGEIVCIKGKNGSGKSTLLKIIAGLVFPSSGRLIVNFSDNNPLPKRVAFCPDIPNLNGKLTVVKFLHYIASLVEMKNQKNRINQWLEMFNLSKWKNEPIDTLSKGMQHKLSLIASIIDSPQIILIDEPFLSLDRNGETTLIKEMRRVSQLGGGIVITSPHELTQFPIDKEIELGILK